MGYADGQIKRILRDDCRRQDGLLFWRKVPWMAGNAIIAAAAGMALSVEY